MAVQSDQWWVGVREKSEVVGDERWDGQRRLTQQIGVDLFFFISCSDFGSYITFTHCYVILTSTVKKKDRLPSQADQSDRHENGDRSARIGSFEM